MTRKHLVVAYAALVLATPFAVWGLLPDMSEPDGTDFLIEPVVSQTIGRMIGATAAAVIVAAIAVVRSPAGRRRRRRLDRRVVVPLVLAGAYVGFAYRAATSGVVGANIGGALLVMLGVPLVPGLLVLAAIGMWRLRNRDAGS